MKMKRNAKWMVTALVGVSLLLSGCQTGETQQEVTNNQPSQAEGATKEPAKSKEIFEYKKFEIDQAGRPFLGKEDAPNTIIFVYDYSCPWCKKWMLEQLPKLTKTYIDTGQAKFYSQAVALLNKNSLYLAEVDYLVEKNHPDKYFTVQKLLEEEMGDENVKDWAQPAYVEAKLNEAGLDGKALLDKKGEVPDRMSLTRDYTKNKALQVVPTIYVNGIKMSDAFDLKELGKLLDGTIKEGDTKVLKS